MALCVPRKYTVWLSDVRTRPLVLLGPVCSPASYAPLRVLWLQRRGKVVISIPRQARLCDFKENVVPSTPTTRPLSVEKSYRGCCQNPKSGRYTFCRTPVFVFLHPPTIQQKRWAWGRGQSSCVRKPTPQGVESFVMRPTEVPAVSRVYMDGRSGKKQKAVRVAKRINGTEKK